MRVKFFGEEVQRILRSLESDVDVAIIGTRGSGRTRALRRVVAQAADIGLTSTGVWQSRILHDWDGEALHRILGRVPGPPSPSILAAALIHELRESRTRILVLDDEDWLDPVSRAAIDLAVTEVRVVLLTTRGHATVPGQLTGRPHRRCVHVEMPPMQFDEVGAHMSDLLGGSISTELIARMGSKTGGLIGLVTALTISARDAQRIAKRGGIWTLAAGNLWNAEIDAHVDEMLSDLGENMRQAAHMLVLAGATSIADARALVGDDILVELARARLATVIGAGEAQPRIVLTPPLIADFLRRRPSDMCSAILTEQIAARTLVSQPLPALRPTDAQDIGSGLDASATDTVIARYLKEEHVSRAVMYARIWQETPSLTNALSLLNSVWLSPSLPIDRGEVFSVTKQHDPDASASRDFIFHEAIWAAFSEDDLPSAHRVLEAFAALGPDERRWASCVRLLLESISVGITREMLSEARRVLSDEEPEPLARSISALVHALAGRGATALEAVDGFERWKLGAPRFISRVAYGLALLSIGEEVRLASEARVGLSRARARLSTLDIVVESYLLTFAAARLGRVAEARQVLDLVLLLNDPPIVSRSLQAGISRIAALLALRNGWGVAPQALAAAATQWAPTIGPLPMLQPEFSDVVTDLEERRPDRAARTLERAADACASRGWALAAVETRVTILMLAPSPTTVDALERVLARYGIESHGRLVEFARAVVREPAAAVDLARTYPRDADMCTAMLMLENLRDSEEISTLEVDALNQSAELLREQLGGLVAPQPAWSQVDWTSRLSARESEIALLSATLSSEQIADRLQLSMRTVNNHLANARRKTGTHSRAELLRVLRGGGAPGREGG